MFNFPKYVMISHRQINKTAFLLSNKSSNLALQHEESTPFAAKIQWVMAECDYSLMNQHEIQLEYRKLRKELLVINEDVAFAIEKMNSRPLKKSKNTNIPLQRVVQIRDKQVENNIAIIERLKKQLENLQKRTMACNSTSKDEVEIQIEQIKEKIIKARLKIKELKLKSKAMGNSIQNSDNIYDEIRALENERQASDKKRLKLQQKYDRACYGIDKMISKIQEIHPHYQIAQKYCEQWSEQHKQEGEQRRIAMTHRQKLYMLEITQKNLQSINQSKQQKYHQTLKNLQSAVQKSDKATDKINECEIKVLQCKAVILQLEQKLQELIEKNKGQGGEPTMFFTQIKGKEEDIGEREFDNDHKDDKNGKNKVKTYSKHKQRSARASESRDIQALKARISQMSQHDPPHFTKKTITTPTEYASTELPLSHPPIQKAAQKNNLIDAIPIKQIQKKTNESQTKQKSHPIQDEKVFKRKNSQQKRQSKVRTDFNDFQVDKIEEKVKKISRPSTLKRQEPALKINPAIEIKKQIIKEEKQEPQPINKEVIPKKQQISFKKQSKPQNVDLFIDNIDQKFKFEPKLLNESHYDKQTELNDTSAVIATKKQSKIQKESTSEEKQKQIINRYMQQQQSDDDESMKDFKESIKQNKGRISQKLKIDIDLGSIQDRISKAKPN